MWKIITCLSLVLASIVYSSTPQAAPPGAIPFYCTEAVGKGNEGIIPCYRRDTGALLTPVPSGMYLHVTDIIVNPNSIATSGTFKAMIGLNDSDEYPGLPNIDLIGSPGQQLHFSTPYLVLKAGEELAIHNYASSDFPIDVRCSGYLHTKASP